jgi:acyl-CoA reductase-like NAD-dependent aldehyde dehydrogenase
MCAANMKKNAYVLKNMRQILDALTRGLPLDILSTGYGVESRGVMLSYQANSPVLGMVLPSNSPGVHALWLPVIPMQIGLVIKPGSQEPWTAYRMTEAFFKAGVPREAISLYPGGHDVGGAVMQSCQRTMIFGSQATIDKYAGDPRVQVHGPGFSKILFGDDEVDNWEAHLDTLVDSVLLNGGRSCINVSGIWASRHTDKIADAIAKRVGPVQPPSSLKDPSAKLAAFTVAGQAEAISAEIDEGVQLPGVTEVTARYRDGARLVSHERHSFLRPTVVHCESWEPPIAKAEYMFPFVAVVECPQDKMITNIGPTLVCTALTKDARFQQQLLDATNIDRLNLGDIKTTALNWLQPHEGNIVDFLYRARAFQNAPPPVIA